jgi:TetR/AcrR family transcriptional regulator
MKSMSRKQSKANKPKIYSATASAPMPPNPGPFDKGEQRRRKRAAVLQAAASAFNRRGFANTSLDDVAAALGVSKPTLYQYFENKQDILFACHQVAMDNGEAGLALAAACKGSGLKKLIVYLRRYMEGVFGDLGNCPVLTDVDSLAPPARAAVVARRSRISGATKDLIVEGISDGSISNCDPKLAALFALGVVNWIPLWYREGGPNTPEEIMDTFVTLLTSGLAGESK